MVKQNKEKRKAAPVNTASTPSPRIKRIYWVVPCLAAFVLYVAALRFGFIFDDHTLIATNPQVQSWDYLPRLLTTHLWSQKTEDSTLPQYRPIFSIWLLTVYSLAGLTKWFWHLSSIALHVVATYLVFRLSLHVFENAFFASGAALLFAVHPIHIEPVCWVSSCNELLYTTLVLSSLSLFCYSLPTGRTPTSETLGPGNPVRRSWRWLSVGLWTAAIFTKESALPVLAVFSYVAYKVADQSLAWGLRAQQTLRRSLPYLIAVAFYLGARFLAINRVVGLERGAQTWAQVFYSAPSIIAFYIKKLIFPLNMSGFYVNPLISSPTTMMWVTGAASLLVCGILAWLSLKYVAVGLGSMLLILPMLPVLAGVKVFWQGDLAHDRYMYLPSVGLCILCGAVVKHLRTEKSKVLVDATGGAVLVSFALLTLTQQWYYKDDASYFGRGVQVNPNNVLARDYLGDYYMMHGHMDWALAQFKRAHEIDSEHTYTIFCLARGLFTDHQYAAAQPYLEQLARLRDLAEGQRATVLLALGQTEMRLNYLARSEEVLKQLESQNESYRGLHDTLGALYQTEGKIAEAQHEYEREFEVSGSLLSRQKALRLAQVIRGSPTDP
jgi:hypothetical protein